MNHRFFLSMALVASTLLMLTGCSELMKANRQLSRNAYGEAIISYHAYLADHPDSGPARMGLGEALLRGGDAEAAIPEFEHAASASNAPPEASLLLGLANLKAGHYPAALKYIGGFAAFGFESVRKTAEEGGKRFDENLRAHGNTSPETIAAAEHLYTDIDTALAAWRKAQRNIRGAGGNGGGGSGGG